MPKLLLRPRGSDANDLNAYSVILVMDDGYELDVGGIRLALASVTRTFWAWSCPESYGEADSRDEAMAKFRAAFASVMPEAHAKDRQQQEWTSNKYALWDRGYRNKLDRGPIRCACGEMFDLGIHEETMAHIEHITGRKAGT